MHFDFLQGTVYFKALRSWLRSRVATWSRVAANKILNNFFACMFDDYLKVFFLGFKENLIYLFQNKFLFRIL